MKRYEDGLGVDFVPIDFHCHGIGPFDFAEPKELLLGRIEKQLRTENAYAIVTLYVPRPALGDLIALCRTYAEMQQRGEVAHILGIGTEGPLFSAHGGTPRSGKWTPTKSEWQAFAALGASGLRYMVLSPDAECGSHLGEEYPPSLAWIIELLYEGRVTPALGHFSKCGPEASAAKVREVADLVERRGYGYLFTDHLFNDMPLKFTHAWRGLRAKTRRNDELPTIGLEGWTRHNLERTMGPVPAAIIDAAQRGVAKICMNFDGEHVDLEVCKRTVELVGSRNIMMMTDRIQSRVLAGQTLSARADTGLLYQADGVVAGGTSAPWQQVENMRRIGLSNAQIVDICRRTPLRALCVSDPCKGSANCTAKLGSCSVVG